MDGWTLTFVVIGIAWVANKFMDLVEYFDHPRKR